MNYGIVEKNIGKVKQLLSEGLSAIKIAKELGCAKSSVLKKIKEHNLQSNFKWSADPNNFLKDKFELIINKFNNGTSINQISKDIGHSESEVWKLLNKNGYDTSKHKCKYTLDETFFEKIDTEEKAYILGFWYSDGNVMSSGKIRIGIKSEDEEVLIKIRNCMKWTGDFQYKPAKGNKKPQTILNIDRQKVAKDLIKLGCPPNKSLILEFPTEQIIPNNLLHHFLRGMFDGDGGFNIRKGKIYGCGITSTDKFCNKLKEICLEKQVEPTNFYYRKKGKPTGTLFFGRLSEVKKFTEFIYQDATIYMQRKYDIYHNLKAN